MKRLSFIDLLSTKWNEQKFICVGLDPDLDKIPSSVKSKYKSVTDIFYHFNTAIIDATADLVCAYKPNPAFYEAVGIEGIQALYKTVQYVQNNYPDIAIIYDSKRGDIGNTNKGYVTSAFDHLKADAVTVQPYLGREAIQPFLDRKDKFVLILVKTSNPGAGEFQDLEVGKTQQTLYSVVSKHIVEAWNENNNCGIVVGATYPQELAEIRKIVGDMTILIPGVGAQGGGIEETVRAGKNSKRQGMVINISRGVLYAAKGQDFAKAGRKEVETLQKQIIRSM